MKSINYFETIQFHQIISQMFQNFDLFIDIFAENQQQKTFTDQQLAKHKRNIARIAKSAQHKLHEKSSFNVRSVCPVSPL